MDKLFLKFIFKLKGSQIAKTILKKDKATKLTPPNLKIYYIATVIKCGTSIRMDISQWNRIKSP